MDNPALVSSLKTVGLTDYQAKSLIALMKMGAGTPRDVAQESGIPYPSAYDSLRALYKQGWVEFASARPSIFRVREPKFMQERISSQLKELFEKLQGQYNSIREESSKLALIYTIVGPENVSTKLIELLAAAEKSVIAVLPSCILEGQAGEGERISLSRTSLQKLLSNPLADMRLITDRGFSNVIGLKKEKVRIRDSILAIDILIDYQKALIGLTDFSVCGWVDSPIISSHFGQFLELLWKDSRSFRKPISVKG